MDKIKRPKVGIALLTYNYGRYIDDAIESLKKQTFQDFEIYLVDDGSNDGATPEKVKSLDYEKITKKILYKQNKGNAVRRKELYKAMTNDYILDMSADDILMPEFLKKTVKFLEKHSDVGAVCVDMYEYMDDFSGEPFFEYKYDRKKMKLPEMLAECHFLGSALTRKEALDDADLTGEIRRYADWDKWISILEAGWRLDVINEFLFCYRIHMDSLSHTSSGESETEVYSLILKKHKKLFNKYSSEVAEKLFYQLFSTVRSNDYVMKELLELRETRKELLIEIERLKSERMITIFSRRVRENLRKWRNKNEKK